MKRGREDKGEGSKPIVRKEKRVLFGVHHSIIEHTIQEEEDNINEYPNNSKSSRLNGTRTHNSKTDNNNNKNNDKQKDQGLLATGGDDVARSTAPHITSTAQVKESVDSYLAEPELTLQCQHFERLTFGLAGRSEDDVTDADDDTNPRSRSKDLGHLVPRLGSEHPSDESRSYTGSKTGPGGTEPGIQSDNKKSSTVRQNPTLVAEVPEPLFSSYDNPRAENFRVSPSVTHASAADIEIQDDQFDDFPPNRDSILRRRFHSVGNINEERVSLDSDDETFGSPPINSLTRRRSSILQLQACSAEGVQVKTHIKLQRAKISGKDSGQTKNKKAPVEISDMMKAFNATRHSHLSESEDSTIVSSSIPNISTRKPGRYLKKLKALMGSKQSKSLGELASLDMNEIDFKTNKGVDHHANERRRRVVRSP
ncbi:hypothetical protein EGW08_010223 [Elysia chlorotica]|uniref:Uncharacterized protein n=1 Tax=Elysia chlorotica TaxID=188477 RepID=A0A3S1B7Z4_ELYCH|nr:hypothetical protein EGW08_010223 [Elysia chlorotica]